MFGFVRRRELEARRKGFSKGITIGAVLGSLIGGLTGVLTAPDSGENTRRRLQENALEIKDSVENDLLEAKDKINGEIAQSIEWLRKEISDAKEVFKMQKIECEASDDKDLDKEAL